MGTSHTGSVDFNVLGCVLAACKKVTSYTGSGDFNLHARREIPYKIRSAWAASGSALFCANL